MSAAEKTKGPYKQFFACECGSRFGNEDELKIHFCLSHNGETEVKVRVQRIYKKSDAPNQKNAIDSPERFPGPSKVTFENLPNITMSTNIAKALASKLPPMKIVSVQEENSTKKSPLKTIATPKKINSFEERNQFIKQNISNKVKNEGVTLYKSEPTEKNVIIKESPQKKNVIKPIVIPISQMKPNSYVIQKPAKKEPIQVFKCGDNKFVVRNTQATSPVIKNVVSLQNSVVSGGKPEYIIEGDQDYVVEEDQFAQDVTGDGSNVIKEEAYEEYIEEDEDSQEYIEEGDDNNQSQEPDYEQEEYPEYVTEEYITGETGSVEEEESTITPKEEQEDYEVMLEAHEVVESSAVEVKKRAPKRKRKGAVDGETFPCTICDRTFTKSMSLTQHLIQMHRPMVTSSELAPSHRRRANKLTEKQDLKCDICNREFYGKHALAVHRVKAHVDVNQIERPFKCDLCDKAYRNNTLLSYHMRYHNGVKPYKCSYCPKAFVLAQGLQLHERTHTGERPEQCRKCDKAFRCQTALMRHEKVHSGEKPYACPHCHKCFSQSNSVKLHIITVHMKLPSPYKSHHNRYRKRREKLLQKQAEEEAKQENVEEMEVFFGSDDDAAVYEEVYE